MQRLLLGLCLLGGCARGGSSTDPAGPAGREECEAPETPIVEGLVELATPADSLQRLVRYPAAALAAGIEGRVIVDVVVDSTGTVTDAEIVRGLGYGLDAEALRVARRARFRWLAGGCGVPSQARTGLSIVFAVPASERRRP